MTENSSPRDHRTQEIDTATTSQQEAAERKAQLDALRDAAQSGGGTARVETQHKAGKLTARERLLLLLDEDSFDERDAFVEHQESLFGMADRRFPGDGVVSGFGRIDGRRVAIFSQDFTVFGGSLSASNAKKIAKVMDLALKVGTPVIGLNDSGGARIQEGVASLAGYGEIFRRNTFASGVVPQISVILGPCAGGAVYSPALTDFVFMVDGTSHMFVTGPDVVRAVTHETIDQDQLGGAAIHGERSGVAHFCAPDEPSCFEQIQKLLEFLPDNNSQTAPRRVARPSTDPKGERLEHLVPDEPERPYDMLEIICAIVDGGEFFAVHEHFARNLITGFAHLGGEVVGVVANQPAVIAGTLDIDASTKGGRFIRFCDCFNIPVVTFVDVPGFLPGREQEHAGIIRHGAKLLFAYCEATVPKITVITRKAYGGAYVVMGSKSTGSDLNLAWPSAEIAVMGAAGAVKIVSRREIAASEDPTATEAKLVRQYRQRFANPFAAAKQGFIDDVIDPAETRERLLRGLALVRGKREPRLAKKHGNPPL